MSSETVSPTSSHDEAHEDYDEVSAEHGLSDRGYVKIFAVLVAITAFEVLLSYNVDTLGPAFIPLLVISMGLKFFIVILYFMHLKFDSRMFSLFFYMGMVLALMVYLGMLLTFKFFG